VAEPPIAWLHQQCVHVVCIEPVTDAIVSRPGCTVGEGLSAIRRDLDVDILFEDRVDLPKPCRGPSQWSSHMVDSVRSKTFHLMGRPSGHGLTTKPDLRVCANHAELSRRSAEATVRTINDAVRTAGTCSIVLSGGSTPRALYSLLASEFRGQIPWANVQVFWGDERFVPSEDPGSNYRMAKETLLDHVPCPPANIHPMPTHFPDVDAAARDYERTLRNHFVGQWPRFDLVLLGIGDDGHTASLFPGTLALAERTRWVTPARAPVEPHVRLTMTLPALIRAAAIHVLVAGATKAGALRHVLEGAGDWIKYPAAAIRLGAESVIWWADREAAAFADERSGLSHASCGETSGDGSQGGSGGDVPKSEERLDSRPNDRVPQTKLRSPRKQTSDE
jgi:6-phosphogluconolactonase